MAGEEPSVSGKIGVSGVAGRYATALFELADEGGALDAVSADLAQFAELARTNRDLARVLKSPLYSRDDQARALDEIGQRIGVSPITRKFIGLLAQKRRLFSLLDIVAAFDALVSNKRGEIKAKVISAQPLRDGESQAISDILRVAFRRDVKLENAVDPSILGGLIVKVGSRMIDSSLATKLNRLKLAMKQA